MKKKSCASRNVAAGGGLVLSGHPGDDIDHGQILLSVSATCPPVRAVVNLLGAARTISCSKRHIYALVRQGELQLVNVSLNGRHPHGLRISRESLEAFLQRRIVKGESVV